MWRLSKLVHKSNLAECLRMQAKEMYWHTHTNAKLHQRHCQLEMVHTVEDHYSILVFQVFPNNALVWSVPNKRDLWGFLFFCVGKQILTWHPCVCNTYHRHWTCMLQLGCVHILIHDAKLFVYLVLFKVQHSIWDVYFSYTYVQKHAYQYVSSVHCIFHLLRMWFSIDHFVNLN